MGIDSVDGFSAVLVGVLDLSPRVVDPIVLFWFSHERFAVIPGSISARVGPNGTERVPFGWHRGGAGGHRRRVEIKRSRRSRKRD